jgi:hypothetical protein
MNDYYYDNLHNEIQLIKDFYRFTPNELKRYIDRIKDLYLKEYINLLLNNHPEYLEYFL